MLPHFFFYFTYDNTEALSQGEPGSMFIKSRFKKLRQSISHMRLTDRFLLVFLLLLLLQSTHHIFFYEQLPTGYESLDTMIRSSAATIFGYFISGAFGGESKIQKTDVLMPSVTKEETQMQARESKLSVTNEIPNPLNIPENTHLSKVQRCRIQQQILIVAGIGLFSILILFHARIFGPAHTHATAALSQFQDFLVGSIGFLVGHARYDG